MPSLLDAVVAGLIQGLLEWLPVSSSGQVTLFLAGLFGYSIGEAYRMSLFLHFGTLISALVFFYRDIYVALARLFHFKLDPVTKLWIYGTIYSLIIGVPIYFIYNEIVGELNLDVISAIIGATLIGLGLFMKKVRAFGEKSLDKMSRRDYLILGIAQGIAVLPGVSRSGLTILVLLLSGFSSWEAVRTSFLASIPVIFLASLYTGFSEHFIFEPTGLVALSTAFLSGLLGIAVMYLLSRKLPLYYFPIAAGIIVLAITLPALFF